MTTGASYCRNCGREIVFLRTKNEKWMPCDFATGAPHFCAKEDAEISKKTGIETCPRCGKPTFKKEIRGIHIVYDFSSLRRHVCDAKNIKSYQKYLKKQRNVKK